jgi:hypothetical protein
VLTHTDSRERKDATAGFSTVQKDAATELIWPGIVDAVVKVSDWAASLKQSKI